MEALAPNLVGEIVGGVLSANPRLAMPHAAATSALGEELGPPFERGRGGPGGWVILDEPELHLGEDVVVPDLAGWRRERMPEIPSAAFVTLAPDWLCEALSRCSGRAEHAPPRDRRRGERGGERDGGRDCAVRDGSPRIEGDVSI